MVEPLPPRHPFTAAEAGLLGIGRHQLRALIESGRVAHPLYGVYTPGDWPNDASSRAQAMAHVAPPHCVVVDRSAASLHGIDVLDYAELDVPPRLEVASIRGATRSRRTGVLGGERDLLPDEIMSIGAVLVTTPERTACDLGCLRGRRRAFGVIEAFRTRFDLSQAALSRLMPRFAGRRGVTQLRELIPLSRVGADSQPESWVAIDTFDEGYPMPAAQAWVLVPGYGRARVENAFVHLRIAVEYDGEEFHTEGEDVRHDEERREALRRAGWIIIVVRRDGFSGDGRDRWLAELSQAYAERAPIEMRKRIYARSPDKPMRRPNTIRP
jgi:hypothetical protein